MSKEDFKNILTNNGRVTAFDEYGSDEASNGRLWTKVDDSELRGIRLNFYLGNITRNLAIYGVAVNRFHYNHWRVFGLPGQGDLELIDEIARVPSDFTQDYYYESEQRGGVGPCQDLPVGYVFGRVVEVGGDTVEAVNDLMNNGASPRLVRAIIANA